MQLSKRIEREKERRNKVQFAKSRGVPMPVGSGQCLGCISNSRAFTAVMYFDILTAVFILTIPRAVGAIRQKMKGDTEPTNYTELRVFNWCLIILLTLLGLFLYSYNTVDDSEMDIDKQNTEKVSEIIGLSAGMVIGFLLDFHFCMVVAYKTKQLNYERDSKIN